MAKKVTTRVAQPAPITNQQLMLMWIWILAGLIFIGGLWAWYQYIHRSTYGVFWDTIDNNLNINGVTRRVEQTNAGAKIDSRLQISLGAENMARGLTTISQQDQSGATTTIITETLGTPTNNYARYIDITSAGKQDISSIRNVWSKELLIKGQQQNESVLAEGIFSSIPFARLSLSQRQELVKYMKDNKVYDVDYRGATVVERSGKQAYEYKVAVDLEGYINVLKKIDDMMGLKQMTAADPSAYADAEPAQLTVSTSIDGRQLLEVTFNGASRREEYSSYGAQINTILPETNLPRAELEQKIQKIFAPKP